MRTNKLKILPLFFLLIGCLTTIRAQDETPNPPSANQPSRPGLLAQLNLTREQIHQIREINQRNRPQIREANQRLREANQNLDAAIYGDVADEADIQSKIKEVHAAHAEVVKLRTQTEFAVRKVLTTEQLAVFREIRQRSMVEKEVAPRLRNNRMKNQNRPINNLRRQNRPSN